MPVSVAPGQRKNIGLPVATEQKVALSRPVYWTAKLHTDVAADLGLFVVGTRTRVNRQHTARGTDYPLRLQFWRLHPSGSNGTENWLHEATNEQLQGF